MSHQDFDKRFYYNYWIQGKNTIKKKKCLNWHNKKVIKNFTITGVSLNGQPMAVTGTWHSETFSTWRWVPDTLWLEALVALLNKLPQDLVVYFTTPVSSSNTVQFSSMDNPVSPWVSSAATVAGVAVKTEPASWDTMHLHNPSLDCWVLYQYNQPIKTTRYTQWESQCDNNISLSHSQYSGFKDRQAPLLEPPWASGSPSLRHQPQSRECGWLLGMPCCCGTSASSNNLMH